MSTDKNSKPKTTARVLYRKNPPQRQQQMSDTPQQETTKRKRETEEGAIDLEDDTVEIEYSESDEIDEEECETLDDLSEREEEEEEEEECYEDSENSEDSDSFEDEDDDMEEIKDPLADHSAIPPKTGDPEGNNDVDDDHSEGDADDDNNDDEEEDVEGEMEEEDNMELVIETMKRFREKYNHGGKTQRINDAAFLYLEGILLQLCELEDLIQQNASERKIQARCQDLNFCFQRYQSIHQRSAGPLSQYDDIIAHATALQQIGCPLEL